MRRTEYQECLACQVEIIGFSSIYQHCKRSLVWQLGLLLPFLSFYFQTHSNCQNKDSLFRVYIWMLIICFESTNNSKRECCFLPFFQVQRHVKCHDVLINALHVGEKRSLGSILRVRAGQQLHDGQKCVISWSCSEVCRLRGISRFTAGYSQLSQDLLGM